MEFGIEKCAMLIMKNEKEKQWRNRTAKSGVYRNTWRKGKLPVLGKTENGYYQTNTDERKNRKKITSEEQENFLKLRSAAEISSKG